MASRRGWRVRGAKRENLPAPFWRNPFHSSSEIIRYVKLNYFSHSLLLLFCFSSPQLFCSTTPSRIDSGRTCSTGAWSKVPYKPRMTSSTWLFSYELCSCRSCFPSCNQGYPHHPVRARKPHQTRTHGWTRPSYSGCRTVVTLLLRDCSRIFAPVRQKRDVSEGKTDRAGRTSSNITLQFGSGVECALLSYEDFSSSKRRNQNARKNDDDLEKQADPRNSHRSSHVLPLPCPSPRRLIAGSTSGPVSYDGRSLGDLRLAFCETEITGRPVARRHRRPWSPIP